MIKSIKPACLALFLLSVGSSPGWGDTLSSGASFYDDSPLANASDGDLHSCARPRRPAPVPTGDALGAPAENKPQVDYTLTFAEPRTINRIRFIQSPYAFATAYRILGKSPGSDSFDRVLVVADDMLTPVGEWVEHRIPEVELAAVKLETLNGFAESDPYPALAELQADRVVEKRKEGDSGEPATLSASVALDEVLSINGVSRIPDAMFSVGNIEGDHEFVQKYIVPLNLGSVSLWHEDFLGSMPAPEDPKAPGKFDRGFFGNATFDRVFAEKRSQLDATAQIGAFANLALVKAPPYMRRADFKSTADGRYKDETQFFPPKDPVEWGDFAGRMIKAINERTSGLVRWAYVWNEPNSGRFLPVPWSQKASTYMDLFRKAVPEIERLNPGIKVGGPVITGGGVLGWSGSNDLAAWNGWAKRFIDECGPLADHFDAHYYRVDVNCLKAEANLLANYTHNRLGRVLPIAASEGNVYLWSQKQVDETAARWRYITVNDADLLLNALDLPDKMEAFSYFYIVDWQGLFGMFTNGDHRPNPIYWFYYLVRNLRGERLPAESGSRQVNLVAARTKDGFNVVLQNKAGRRQVMNLAFAGLPATVTELEMERLEYDPAAKTAALSKTTIPVVDGRVSFGMSPYGMYSIIGHEKQAVPAAAVRTRTDYYGDRVFQELTDDIHPLVIKTDLPEDVRRADGAILKLSVGGIPQARPRRVVDRRVALDVTVNGKRHRLLATNYNEIALPPALLHAGANTIEIMRDERPQKDPRVVRPEHLWITSAVLELRAKATR